jgi:fibronectin type 3 domain-containing protein
VIPQPPTNVAQGPVSPGSIGVIWEFSLSGDATGYNVYRSTTSGGPYTQVGSLPASAFSFTDTSVASGTTYYYVVRAAAGSVESVNSNEVAIQAP